MDVSKLQPALGGNAPRIATVNHPQTRQAVFRRKYSGSFSPFGRRGQRGALLAVEIPPDAASRAAIFVAQTVRFREGDHSFEERAGFRLRARKGKRQLIRLPFGDHSFDGWDTPIEPNAGRLVWGKTTPEFHRVGRVSGANLTFGHLHQAWLVARRPAFEQHPSNLLPRVHAAGSDQRIKLGTQHAVASAKSRDNPKRVRV